jgi:hypothetical protein
MKPAKSLLDPASDNEVDDQELAAPEMLAKLATAAAIEAKGTSTDAACWPRRLTSLRLLEALLVELRPWPGGRLLFCSSHCWGLDSPSHREGEKVILSMRMFSSLCAKRYTGGITLVLLNLINAEDYVAINLKG